MTTTLHDFGRGSERFGDIPFYYAFPIKLWFGQNMTVPDDVLTWCRANCQGVYKVRCYTHEDSKRDPKTRKFSEKIMYADAVFLANEADAALIKLTFDVRETTVKRPKLETERAARVPRGKILNPTSPEGIAEATRRHALKHAPKGAVKNKRKAVV